MKLLGVAMGCLGDAHAIGCVEQLRQEVLNRFGTAGIPDDRTLKQAIKDYSVKHLQEMLPPTPDREYRASKMVNSRDVIEMPKMWKQVLWEFSKSVILHPVRSDKVVLVIAPGFGFNANPRQIQYLRRGGWRLQECYAEDPESHAFNMNMAIEPVFSKMSKNVDYEISKMNYDYSVL